MSSEECTTTLSKKRVPLKALLLLLIFAFGSFTVSGTVLPFTISYAHKTIGSFVLTVSPSVIAIPQGMNATSTVTILSTQGFTGTVALTANVTSGIAVIFNPSGVNVPVGGTATSITSRSWKKASQQLSPVNGHGQPASRLWSVRLSLLDYCRCWIHQFDKYYPIWQEWLQWLRDALCNRAIRISRGDGRSKPGKPYCGSHE